MSSAIKRTEAVVGWTLGFAEGDVEPRVLDVDLAARLGFERPRTIRDLIRRLLRDGKLKESDLCRIVRQSGGRPAEEFWLSEKGALKVVASSETEAAHLILEEVFDVYLAWRRGSAPVRPARSAARVEDNPMAIASLRRGANRVVRARGYTIQRVYGFVRRSRVLSTPFKLPLDDLHDVLFDLEQIEEGHSHLLTAAQLRLLSSPRNKRQLAFSGKGWR